ncbi:MAG: RusA family crossover junction endodeoxyribonuclease [Oscillospiraceae bacterium]
MPEIKYTVKLPPITKKNSQQILTNKKTGRPFIAPSSQYKTYADKAGWFLKPTPPQPIDCECNVKCLFYLPTRRKTDLTNLLEAIDDILVSCGVLEDDNYSIVTAHDGSRCFYDKENPRTEIIITKLPSDVQSGLF